MGSEDRKQLRGVADERSLHREYRHRKKSHRWCLYKTKSISKFDGQLRCMVYGALALLAINIAILSVQSSGRVGTLTDGKTTFVAIAIIDLSVLARGPPSTRS